METSRLHLRCVALKDAEATAVLMTKAVSDWLASWPTPFTTEMARRRIEQARLSARRGEAIPCAIILKNSQALAGWVTLTKNENDARCGSLGYWLGAQYHFQGIAREAVRAVLAAGFDLLGLDSIEAGAQAENFASFAVMRACGMTGIGTRMVHAAARNQDEPCAFYGISRAAFASTGL